MPHLLKLPRELRDKILDIVLAAAPSSKASTHDFLWKPPPPFVDATNHPAHGLLSTNAQLRAEITDRAQKHPLTLDAFQIKNKRLSCVWRGARLLCNPRPLDTVIINVDLRLGYWPRMVNHLVTGVVRCFHPEGEQRKATTVGLPPNNTFKTLQLHLNTTADSYPQIAGRPQPLVQEMVDWANARAERFWLAFYKQLPLTDPDVLEPRDDPNEPLARLCREDPDVDGALNAEWVIYVNGSRRKSISIAQNRLSSKPPSNAYFTGFVLTEK